MSVSPHESSRPAIIQPRAAFAIGTWSALTLVLVVIISRRVDGSFSSNEWRGLPGLAATLASLTAVVAHIAWSTAGGSVQSARSHLIAGALTVILPVSLGAALWTFPSALTGGALAGVLIVSALAVAMQQDFFAWRPEPHPRPIVAQGGIAREEQPARPLAHFGTETTAAELAIAPEAAVNDEDEEAEGIDESILQRMTRRQLPGGQETVEGVLRVHFARGEKVAVAHLAFVPPLAARPEAECEIASDFEGRARVAAAHTYGLRIEVRRSQGGSETAVEIGFFAQVRATRAAAA